MKNWSPDSWQTKLALQQVDYEDAERFQIVLERIGRLPPLVTSWEIESLKADLGKAAVGEAFLLQGGDCSESFDECQPDTITSKLKILLQMSLVLIYGCKKHVIRVGRFADQPRLHVHFRLLRDSSCEGGRLRRRRQQTAYQRLPRSRATNAAFAAETVIDEICEKLEIEPLEFRWNSAAKEGTRRVDGPQFSRIGMWETVDAIKKSEHWKSPKDAKQPYDADGIEYAYGRGIASGFWFNAGLKSSVTATVRPDGTVSLVEGSTDIGDTRTSIAMQLAETLGIAAEDVHPTVADTDGVGYTDVTGGSRVTYATGWAAYEGAKDIERQLIERAAEIWETDSENVTYRNGTVHGPDGQSFTFKEFAKKLNNTGGPISGRGVSDHNEPGGAFATLLVDVAVDRETGKVKTSATPPRRMSARRFTPLMSKDKCRGESCRESAGHSTKNTFTTKTAQCKIPRFWITACRRANDRNADCRSCQSRPSLRRSGCG